MHWEPGQQQDKRVQPDDVRTKDYCSNIPVRAMLTETLSKSCLHSQHHLRALPREKKTPGDTEFPESYRWAMPD